MHSIAENLGAERFKSLPAFHALTGSDCTSAFFGKGKKSAWAVWQSLPELTVPLLLISSPNTTTQDALVQNMATFEKFVVKMYGLSDDISGVDEARHHLFLHKAKDFTQMPPSSDALFLHLLRVSYQVGTFYLCSRQKFCIQIFQSGHVWGAMLNRIQNLPSPETWGWRLSGKLQPVFTSLPPLSKSLPELITCGCKRVCKPPCRCHSGGIPCMPLCGCRMQCTNKAS